MNVLEQAFDLYEKAGWTREDFYRDLILYKKEGLIFTDDEIVLYRAVHTDWHEDLVVDFDGKDPEGERNCWYVHVAILVTRKNLKYYLPYHKPFISFVHRNKFKIIPSNKLI